LMTLEVGDVIATGTPSGVGISRDPQLLLNPGDVVEVEIERIGRLRNPVHPPTATDHEYNAVADANLMRS
jgi:2-keto-4-pentenoate hydratase/2-oxohepta-3-ene-1,7-dioic acid hydratase in catechol pathway